MWNGFSSYQLVYGRSSNIHNVMTDTPGSISNRTINKQFADVNASYSARGAA